MLADANAVNGEADEEKRRGRSGKRRKGTEGSREEENDQKREANEGYRGCKDGFGGDSWPQSRCGEHDGWELSDTFS